MSGLDSQPLRSLQSRWRFFTLLVALGVFVAACGTDDSGDATNTVAAGVAVTSGAPERFEGHLAGLTVIDENTFTVELYEANAEFPLLLFFPQFLALPDSAFVDPVAQNEMPIGNGPFMMAGPWEHGVRIMAVPYPDHRGPYPAKVDSYEWVLHLSPEAAYSETPAGNVDVMMVPDALFESAPGDFGANCIEIDMPNIFSLQIQVYLEQYTKEHRRALSMAIDRERLAAELYDSKATAAHSVIPRALGGRDEVCDNWSYHPEEARELWDAAGGLDEITIWFPGGREGEMQAVVDMWGETLGIDTTIVTFEGRGWDDFMSAFYEDEISGLYREGRSMDYPSPLNFLEPVFASYMTIDQGGSNATGYNNPDFDAALAAGKAKVAAGGLLEDGMADYLAAEDLLCDDVPTIPLYSTKYRLVHSDNLNQFYVDGTGVLGYDTIETDNDGVVQHLSPEPVSLFSTDGMADPTVLRALNTGLIDINSRTNRPFNAHALSITSEDGGKTWTTVLKPGWTFHDGTPNDAASYVKTWSYGAAAGERSSGIYSIIAGSDDLKPDEG